MIQFDIHFQNAKEAQMETVKTFLDNLSEKAKMAMAAIKDDYSGAQKGEYPNQSKDYIDHHADVFEAADLEILLKNTDKTLSVHDQLFSLVHLHRVGFYVGFAVSAPVLVVLDHKISANGVTTDYLIVVSMDELGEVKSIDMES